MVFGKKNWVLYEGEYKIVCLILESEVQPQTWSIRFRNMIRHLTNYKATAAFHFIWGLNQMVAASVRSWN